MLQSARLAMLDEADAYAKSRGEFAEVLQPLAWSPRHVETRLVEAFEILFKIGSTPGPKAFGSNWPGILREFSELVDAQAFAEHQKVKNQIRLRPTVEQISRMDEALRWPAQYLTSFELAADALNLWAACKAIDRSIADVLRARNQRARTIAECMQRCQNRALDRARAAAANEVSSWANRRMADGPCDPERASRIKASAHIRFERAVKDLRPVMIKFSQAMPGKVLSRTSLDRYRYAASSMICERLAGMGEVVR